MKKVITGILAAAVMAVSASALDMPIHNKQDIYLENGAFTVLEFPFDIKKTVLGGFIGKRKVKEQTTLQKAKDAVTNKKSGKTAATPPSEPKPVNIKQGTRSLTILPKQVGHFELVVWGYNKYPIMLTFHVAAPDAKGKMADGNKVENYFNFIDYQIDEQKAETFEQTAHEKVITLLIRAIYNDKLPSGYKRTQYSQLFDKDGDISHRLNRAFIGSRYRVDEYILKNNLQETLRLYEEMFAAENVYAVALENELLKAGEMGRVFIVRANTKER
ncbi:hypothetical protein ACXWTF_12515 [Thiomicrolovo sp. ZZH C-3]